MPAGGSAWILQLGRIYAGHAKVVLRIGIMADSTVKQEVSHETYTVVWTDYRFYSSNFFFPEALTKKSKTNAYMGHLL